MTAMELRPGLAHEEAMTVEPRHTVPQIAAWKGFEGMPPVFATAMMIGFMEQTCIQAIAGLLPPGSITVGTHVDMSHVAASPVGATITARVELAEATQRTLLFKVQCRDERGVIGEGLHRRAVVNHERFLQRLS